MGRNSIKFRGILIKLVVGLGLFLGGVGLMVFRVPGWGMIVGIPAANIGMVMLIFVFDEVAHKKNGVDSLKIVKCRICRSPTVALPGEKEKVCSLCQEKMIEASKSEK